MALSNQEYLVNKAYQSWLEIKEHWPLPVSSSGGGGHNAAINALVQHYLKQHLKGEFKLISTPLPTYVPVKPEEKPRDIMQRSQIELGLGLPGPIKGALNYMGLPALPNTKEIKEEVNRLIKLNSQSRSYVDMLLDVYPTGYEHTAIWNTLQKQDKTDVLKKLIELQKNNDYFNYTTVYQYFTKTLVQAAFNGNPYTEIISSQAMALSALCDAVINYNSQIASQYSLPPIIIHQYLTDIPSKGAVHFLTPLKNLNVKQRSSIVLYGVHLFDTEDFNLDGFANLVNIDPKNNPMVREGFYDPELEKIASLDSDVNLSVQCDDKKDEVHTILKNQQIASIMLGSQASIDTIEYVKHLVQSCLFEKIFVYGGKTEHLHGGLMAIDSSKVEMILLDSQDDWHSAPILARSNMVIVRGGGLSMMELMALPHPLGQIILVHSKEDTEGKLTSGISWEDCNVDKLETYLNSNKVQVRRTSVKLIALQLNLLQINKSIQLDNDEDRSKKTLLITSINQMIEKLIRYQKSKSNKMSLTSVTKKQIVKSLIISLTNILKEIDDPTIQIRMIVGKVLDYLRKAQYENNKAYEFKLFLKAVQAQGTLGGLLNEAVREISKFDTTALNHKPISYFNYFKLPFKHR